jgi:hypothetical protein
MSSPIFQKNYIGRCERIRTFDPLHPMQVRYQAAPHTDKLTSITRADRDFDRQSEAGTQQVPQLYELASQQL